MKNKVVTIGDLLTKYVQKIIDINYNNDTCKPTFIVSQLDFKDIILTITHLGWSQSGIIGYETDIEELIQSLYSRTM